MRHFLLSGAIFAHTQGMGETSATAPLIASASLPYRSSADQLRTGSGTITLASVAVAANEYLRATPPAQKESTYRFHQLAPIEPIRYRQEGAFCGTISLHTCSARCGARHRASLAVYIGVVPVLFGTSFLPHVALCCHHPGKGNFKSREKKFLDLECVQRKE